METIEAKENEIRARERQVEKDEDGIVFGQGRTDGQRATIGRACSRTAGVKKGLVAETASKLADKT